MYDGSIETVEYFWVNVSCMLDLVTNTLLLHTVDQLVRSAKNETLCVYPIRDQT